MSTILSACLITEIFFDYKIKIDSERTDKSVIVLVPRSDKFRSFLLRMTF